MRAAHALNRTAKQRRCSVPSALLASPPRRCEGPRTPAVWAWGQRSEASGRTSSASALEPSMREARPERRGVCGGNLGVRSRMGSVPAHGQPALCRETGTATVGDTLDLRPGRVAVGVPHHRLGLNTDASLVSST
jgi:hypothetical protein